MSRNEIIIHWSGEDGVFVAETLEVAECMAPGAIPLWVDTAREFGDPVPEPEGRRLMLA
jgi:predicted RNase H-like HicB family nuclease